LLLLELCSYCQKIIALSINGNSGPADDAMSTSVEGTSVDSAGLALSCEKYYKNNNNLLKILAVICHGLKNEDNSDLVDFNKDPWASLKVSTYCPNLGKWEMRSEEEPGSTLSPSSQQSCQRKIILRPAS
jgi:hypothetical protein